MRYLQKVFNFAVGGSDNYDNVFGRKCFYCRKKIDESLKDEWFYGAHKVCAELKEKEDSSLGIKEEDLK